jgi:hypothetical protein
LKPLKKKSINCKEVKLPYFIFTSGENYKGDLDWGVKYYTHSDFRNIKSIESDYKEILKKNGFDIEIVSQNKDEKWSLNILSLSNKLGGEFLCITIPYNDGRGRPNTSTLVIYLVDGWGSKNTPFLTKEKLINFINDESLTELCKRIEDRKKFQDGRPEQLVINWPMGEGKSEKMSKEFHLFDGEIKKLESVKLSNSNHEIDGKKYNKKIKKNNLKLWIGIFLILSIFVIYSFQNNNKLEKIKPQVVAEKTKNILIDKLVGNWIELFDRINNKKSITHIIFFTLFTPLKCKLFFLFVF